MLDLAALPGLTRAERVQVLDSWLGKLLDDAVTGTPPSRQRRGAPPPQTGTSGIALVAVGSLGRRELPPFGDLDLVLVHDGRPEIASVADALWYPVWDAGVRLDHSVRSIAEAVGVASTDVKAGLGLLDARLVAGDAELAARLRTTTLASWRQSASKLLPQLRDLRRDRARLVGEVAFLLEPDLKEAYGGLREGQVLRAVAAAQLGDEPAAEVEAAYAFLLDVRDELRRRTGRPADVLVRQEQRPVADALGLPDEDALLREVSLAGRRLAFVADETWRRVEAALVRRPRGRYRRVRREPLAEGVVRQGDEVVLAQGARPAADPGLLLRAAAAAARADLLLSPYTLKVLAVHSPPVPEPWPAELRWSFLRLLASGRSAVPVLEQLDQEGLLSRLLPEWDRVRSLPQRHPWHRFTVDRHLVEAAAAASELTRDVDRPDLLLVAALLHDIGKGWPGDHSVVGEPIAAEIGTRMGFSPPDVAVLGALVRHHLLLPATATRRDIDDPATIDRVAATIGHDPALLQLLHALAQADGAATSASAWSPWKAHLVAALVARVQAKLGTPVTAVTQPVLHPGAAQVSASPAAGRGRRGHRRHRGRRRRPAGDHRGPRPVRPAEHLRRRPRPQPARRPRGAHRGRGRVRDGGLRGAPPVRPRAGAGDPRRRRARRAGGHPAARRAAAAAGGGLPAERGPVGAAAHLLAQRGGQRGATGIVEVRAGDRAGLLYRLTAAITGEGLDVTSARIETLGADAVDCFYVCNPSGTPVDADQRRRVDEALVAATGGAVHDVLAAGPADTPG